MAEYQVATAADRRQLTDFFIREGQFLIPRVRSGRGKRKVKKKGDIPIPFGPRIVAGRAGEARHAFREHVTSRGESRHLVGAASTATRNRLRIGRRGQASVFCSFRRWASSSSSSAQPLKYQANISSVALVGLLPVHRFKSRQAMMAQ